MKKNRFILFFFSLLLLLVVGATSFFYTYNNQVKAISSQSEQVLFEVVTGDHTNSIVKRLKDEEVIKSDFFAALYIRLNNHLANVKTGIFQIDRNMSVEEIFSVLTDPTAAITNEVSITFREGIWAKEIASLIEENTNVSATELLSLWNDQAFLEEVITKYEFITDEVLYTEARVNLEGYFFPETYFFYKETNARDVTFTLLNQSEKVFTELKEQIIESGMTYFEILTLASIVQFESATVDQMNLISGIFFNRLEAGMMLQSSVTVCYALYEYTDWTACERDVTIDSPYNTYLHTGLPPGPILNPGKEAIQSVLIPEKSNYFYFIADVCSNGQVYYAETFAEHQANVDKYLTCY